MSAARILVVEDAVSLADYYCQILEKAGYKTRTATSADGAWDALFEFGPVLVLLDIGLEFDMRGGFTLLERLRERGPSVHIMVISAREGDEDIELALELGARNYLVKPVSERVLLARVRAELRGDLRLATRHTHVYQFGNTRIDLVLGMIQRGEKTFTIGEIERRVLSTLLQAPGRRISHDMLLLKCWLYDVDVYAASDYKSVDNCIYRLRKKIEEQPRDPKVILFERGRGYYTPQPN